MRLVLSLVGLLCLAGRLPSQTPPASPLGMSLRLYGGMLNPDDPLQVTIAFGAAAGLRVGKVAVFVRGLQQSQNGNARTDLTTDARTFWGVHLEYEGAPRGRYQRQGLIQVGAGWLERSSFRSTWYVQAGLALRYRVARPLAFVGIVEDYVAKLPFEPARCAPDPAGQPVCDAEIPPHVQHNFGVGVALEVVR